MKRIFRCLFWLVVWIEMLFVKVFLEYRNIGRRGISMVRRREDGGVMCGI